DLPYIRLCSLSLQRDLTIATRAFFYRSTATSPTALFRTKTKRFKAFSSQALAWLSWVACQAQSVSGVCLPPSAFLTREKYDSNLVSLGGTLYSVFELGTSY
ncbi:hypothetical protein SPRG_19944, partial [Saprolegnia parasitica CBS 223.65]